MEHLFIESFKTRYCFYYQSQCLCSDFLWPCLYGKPHSEHLRRHRRFVPFICRMATKLLHKLPSDFCNSIEHPITPTANEPTVARRATTHSVLWGRGSDGRVAASEGGRGPPAAGGAWPRRPGLVVERRAAHGGARGHSPSSSMHPRSSTHRTGLQYLRGQFRPMQSPPEALSTRHANIKRLFVLIWHHSVFLALAGGFV